MSNLSGGTSWRLAARLARREVRRRTGRTMLVMLLVAIPVFAMTVGSVLFRTGTDSHAERFRRANGPADLVSMPSERGRIAAAGVIDGLPSGSHSLVVHDAFVPVMSTNAHRSYLRLTDLPIDDPAVRGMVELREGRVPRDGEVLLSESVASELGVHLGSTLHLARPEGTWKVVGIGRLADEFGADLMVVPGFDFGVVRGGYASERLVVDLPPGTNAAAVARVLGDRGITFEGPTWELNRSGRETVRALAWGWVSGVIALAVMGIIITAAFATSARRQLVTLGQLSANGADQRLLRRALSLQGSWSGLLGSIAGMGAALVGLVVFRGTVESILGHDPGPYVYVASDLVIILLTGIGAATVAAFVPARTITRVPVLAALGGRRPLGEVPRRLMPIGLTLFAGGVGLLTLVAAGTRDGASKSGDLFAIAAVLGGLAVLAGIACVSPVFVGGFGEISSRIGGAGRLAARSVSRVRTRSAAVVTAIATAGAVAVAIATFAGMDSHTPETPVLPDNAVVVERLDDGTDSPSVPPVFGGGKVPVEVPTVDPQPVSAGTRDAVEHIVPGIRFTPVRRALSSVQFTVADPELLDVIGLSDRDAAALAKTGALEMLPSGTPRISEHVVRYESAAGPLDAAIRRDPPASEGGNVSLLVTPRRAAALGLPLVTNELLGIAPSALTADQREQLQMIGTDANLDDAYYTTDRVSSVQESVNVAYPQSVSLTTVQLWIVGGALAFTLLVVAIGLALSAAESRDERDVLVAVGARPRTLRRVAGLKAVFLAVIGAFLAIPAGFVPVTLVVRTAASTLSPVKPVVFPWLTVVLLLVAVPAIAGAATFVGSWLAQRARPLQMSAIAVD